MSSTVALRCAVSQIVALLLAGALFCVIASFYCRAMTHLRAPMKYRVAHCRKHDLPMKLSEFKRVVPPKTRSPMSPFLLDMLELRAHGYSVAQVCDFLARNGLVAKASSVATFLRRRKNVSASPVPNDALAHMATSPQSVAASAAISKAAAPAAAISPAPADADVSSPRSESKYGTHDPRAIDDVLRNPPDMQALRKIGLAMARDHAQKKV